jgi:predicted amidophosphoribosyltransferase
VCAFRTVFPVRYRIHELKHLTPSAWIGELATLRDLLPAASPDLSSSAVARWLAHAGGTCPRCGAFDRSGSAPRPSPCVLCAAVPPPFDVARSLFTYAGDVRAAIVAAKYAGRPYPVDAVALRLRETLTGRWRDLIPDGTPPTVVPVPAHPWKYFRRGFNLPALIASRLSRHLGLPFDPLALSRTRERVPQARLPGNLRHENVEGAFRVPRGRKVASAILLFDDVYTSGATAEACARALKCAGADSIVVVTVARAVP